MSVYLRNKSPEKTKSDFNKIIPKLYLGNINAASSKEFFKKHNIKAVLNCSKEIPNFFENDKSIEYLRIPVHDNLKENEVKMMLKFMPLIAEFIHKHVDILNNNILVHCVEGRSRSPSAVVVFLMKYRNMSAHKACELVIDKRSEAFFYGKSVNFEKSIIKYYKELEKDKECKKKLKNKK